MKPPTAPVSFRIDLKLKARAQRVAKADQRTLTSYMAKVLLEAVERSEAKHRGG